MSTHILTQTTCREQEQNELEEAPGSTGQPAASSRLSWRVTAARADSRERPWRLIASNEQNHSPQKRINWRLPEKWQSFNPLWVGPFTGSFLGIPSPCLERRVSEEHWPGFALQWRAWVWATATPKHCMKWLFLSFSLFFFLCLFHFSSLYVRFSLKKKEKKNKPTTKKRRSPSQDSYLS